jgi:hypothetical protein
VRKSTTWLTTLLAAALSVASSGCQSSQEIGTTSSPDGTYTVSISQQRRLPIGERYVALNASRAGAAIVQSKLLYTGDFMDQDFTALYPRSSWIAESVLRIGQVEAGADDVLRVTNETMRRLTYLLIETYSDKFVLFDVEPRAVVTLRFNYIGQLSAEGQFQDSGSRFADAVALPDRAESVDGEQFSIHVRESALTIDGSRQLRHVACCAADRPSFGRD